MSHPSVARGTRWETAVEAYLQGHAEMLGVPAEDIRRWGDVNGKDDRGDLRGVPGFTVECKDEEKIRLPLYMAEAKKEQANAKTRWYAAIVKARRKPVGQAFVVMELDQFVRIVAALNGGNKNGEADL